MDTPSFLNAHDNGLQPMPLEDGLEPTPAGRLRRVGPSITSAASHAARLAPCQPNRIAAAHTTMLTNTELSERKLQQTKAHELAAKYQAKRDELLKGMNRHYQKVDRQDEIRKLYEQEKQRTQHQKRDKNPDFEPEI